MSVVMLSHEHWEATSRALETLAATRDVEFETIVVDNGSCERVKEAISEVAQSPLGQRLRVRYLLNSSNRGIATGRNQGADMASGRYLLFLDNDVEIVDTSWLVALIRACQSNPLVGIAGAILLDPPPSSTVQFNGGRVDAHCGVHLLGTAQPAEDSIPVPCDFCIGACMLIGRPVWEQVDGFDPLFDPMDYEDIDLCLRARQRGFLCAVVPTARLVHWAHTTTGSRDFGRLRHYLVNGRRFRSRWRDAVQAMR